MEKEKLKREKTRGTIDEKKGDGDKGMLLSDSPPEWIFQSTLEDNQLFSRKRKRTYGKLWKDEKKCTRGRKGERREERKPRENEQELPESYLINIHCQSLPFRILVVMNKKKLKKRFF